MAEVFFNGRAGRIEGCYTRSNMLDAPLALVLHHHPQYGGNMNHTVVLSMYQAFIRNNFSVLRINFRGVGKSAGTFDRGTGELSDATTATDWLHNNNPSSAPLWVAGFAFGAWIAMQLVMRRPEVESFVAISPSANKYDFSFLSPCPVPGLIVQGDQDSISEEALAFALANRLAGSLKSDYMQYKVVQNADHFFRDHLHKVDETLDNYIKLHSYGGRLSESLKSESQNKYHKPAPVTESV